MDIDINLFRNMDAEYHEIPLCDEQLTFFYDETGNCGKFNLREDGVNDPTALRHDFILGGICFLGNHCPADPAQMIAKLNLQSPELKFQNISRSKDFLQYMGSKRATTYIDWLYHSGLMVHFAAMNNLYFALADIVDSLLTIRQKNYISPEQAGQLKSALYAFCKAHLEPALDLLYRYEYPNIHKGKTKQFCSEFLSLIETHLDESASKNWWLLYFRDMLKRIETQEELVFLHDNTSYALIEEYYALYLNRCYTYKYAMHYFYFEKVILPKMNTVRLMDGEQRITNYDFIDSKQNPLIQVCDVFVGLLSSMFAFLDGHTLEELDALPYADYHIQFANIAKIYSLIYKSQTFHPKLIQNINDINLLNERVVKIQQLTKSVIL